MIVQNLDAIGDKLKALADKEAKAVSRKALRRGATLIKKALVAQAPMGQRNHHDRQYESRTHTRGLLKRSIRVKAGMRKAGAVRLIVGMGRQAMYKGYYAAFVLFGHRGVKANDFFKRVIESRQDDAIDAITQKYRDLVQ